jgi:hypothetical protein
MDNVCIPTNRPARVYEGFHFAEGCYAGLKAGNQVADWVYAHEFRPL